MLVAVLPDADAVSRQAATLVAGLLTRKPDCVLGLATGASPRGLYQDLVRRHREDGLDFSRATTVNLDEYLEIPADHPASCRSYMAAHLFSQVNLAPRNIVMPDSQPAGELTAYCAALEQRIAAAGGIDLQILGIGLNGHLGFNEPGSSLGSRCRIVRLTDTTRTANRGNFPDGEVPTAAITLGLGTIAEARRLLLLATGAAKAEMVAAALEGPVTAGLPASLLQMHRDVVVLLDPAAAARLTRLDHYAAGLEMVRRLTPERLA